MITTIKNLVACFKKYSIQDDARPGSPFSNALLKNDPNLFNLYKRKPTKKKLKSTMEYY